MLGLCDRFKCLPSQLYGEDSELIRMITIESMGRRREEEPDAEHG